MSSLALTPSGATLVEVFAAACTGTARLSGETGLPIVHIDASTDGDATVEALRDRHYGCAVRRPDFFQPLSIETGWNDWAMFEIDPTIGAAGLSPSGIEISRGRIVAHLPPAVTFSEFREQLRSSLRHLRMQEAAIQMPFLESRSDAFMAYTVHPRYTLRAPDADFRGAVLCEDIYVFDPAELGWRLVWIVVAARLAADGCRRLWR